jgi:TonB family protein
MLKPIAIIAGSVGAALLLAQEPAGPRFRSGSVPELPAMAIEGGEVLLDVVVNADGRVSKVTPLRSTPPFTDAAIAAVRGWEFMPAEDARRRGASDVLVAALFRPPALYTAPPGGAANDVAPAPAEIPFPIATAAPVFPPLAHSGGVVLVEALVTVTGAVAQATVIQPAPPFDAPAITAARQWRFRPARIGGTAAPSLVYIVFGFPAPIVASPAPRTPGGRAPR